MYEEDQTMVKTPDALLETNPVEPTDNPYHLQRQPYLSFWKIQNKGFLFANIHAKWTLA